MADKLPIQDIRRNVSSAKRLLLDREILAAAYPELAPSVATAGIQVQHWHQLSVVVYADQSVSGAVLSMIPWMFFDGVKNPTTGDDTGSWIPGSKLDGIPLDYAVTSGPRIVKIPLGMADRVFLQVSEISGANPNWLRLGIFGDIPRAFSRPQAIAVGGC